MTGWLSGFTTQVKKVASECESTHCVIHREMLASWKRTPELNLILQDVINIINHINVHALNSCLFAPLWGVGHRAHSSPLTHRGEMALYRWLTGQHFWVTRAAPEISFRKTVTTSSTFQWHRMGRTYWCDTFNLLNELNLSLQGRTTTAFKSADKVAAFKAKLELWGRWVNFGIFNVSNVSRDFESDWARAFFLPTGAWSPISAFRRVWALVPNHKRHLNWGGMDLWPTCE